MIKTLFLLMIVFSTGCSTTRLPIKGSQIAPGANGLVSVKPMDDGSTRMIVHVKHLYPAEQIWANANNYIIWIKPEGKSNYQNVGSLNVDHDLEGKQSVIIPYKNFNFLMTPEMGKTAIAPIGPSVFEQRTIRQ